MTVQPSETGMSQPPAPPACSVTEAVLGRRSTRAFLDRPVPAELVADILAVAARAPSGGNLQPWRVVALTGGPLVEVEAAVKAAFAANPRGAPAYDIYPPDLWEPFHGRRRACGEDLYATIGVGREQKAERWAHVARNYDFFGAPVGLFFCLERRLGPPQWADLGMYMQTVMLLAVERGLATCPQEAWANFAGVVEATLELPGELMVFAGMALGYADETAPINGLVTAREPLEGFAELRGF